MKPLVGNQDIRDHFSGEFTNSINGVTTQNVFTLAEDGHAGPGDYRIDKQFFDLSAFAAKTCVRTPLPTMAISRSSEHACLVSQSRQCQSLPAWCWLHLRVRRLDCLGLSPVESFVD